MLYKSGKPISFRFQHQEVTYKRGDKIKTEHEEYLKTYYSGRVVNENGLFVFNDGEPLYYVNRGVARTLQFGDMIPEEDTDYILKYHWNLVKPLQERQPKQAKGVERKNELAILKTALEEQTSKLNTLIDLVANQQVIQRTVSVSDEGSTTADSIVPEASVARPRIKTKSKEAYEIALKQAINTDGLQSSGKAGDREKVGAKINDKLERLAKLKQKQQEAEATEN
jgi:hypothetical protein